MRSANDGIINAVMAIGNMIVSAIESQDYSGSGFDGMSVARELYPHLQRLDTIKGASLVH